MEVNQDPQFIVMDIDVYKHLMAEARSRFGVSGHAYLRTVGTHVRKYNSHLAVSMRVYAEFMRANKTEQRKKLLDFVNTHRTKTVWYSPSAKIYIPVAVLGICRAHKTLVQVRIANGLYRPTLVNEKFMVNPNDLLTEKPAGIQLCVGGTYVGCFM